MPAALALALGGVAVATTSASAAPAGLTITSPVEGSTVDSRTVTITGSVYGGSTVIVYAADGTTELERTNPGGSLGEPTPYTVTLPAYASDASTAQTVRVGGIYGASGIPQVTLNFSLPEVAPVFSVTSPTNGQTVDSRTVTFTGIGTNGSTVNVLDTDGNRVTGTTAAVVVDGAWSTTGTYAADAVVSQTVNVNQVTGGAGRGNATVTFTLPAAVPVSNFSVTSPTNGQTVDSRTVTFTGTGTNGSTVNVLDTDGNRVTGTTAAVVVDGAWSTTGTYAADAVVSQTVNVNQVTGGAGRGNATVTFTLPAAAPVEPITLDAPTITSPTEGEVVTGDQVTFEGTGTLEAFIGLVVAPTDLLADLATEQPLTPAAAPENPADPIPVGADGTWSVTLALEPGEYAAVAIQSATEAPTDASEISEPSEPVTFTLEAAAAPTAPAGTPGAGGATPVTVNPTTRPSALASTGSDDVSAFVGLGALLALTGTALVFGARRRIAS